MEKNSLLTTQEVAAYLKLNEKTVLKMAQKGELPGVKLGNQWRFYLSAIDEYLQNKIAKSTNNNIDELIRTTTIMPLSRLIEEDSIILNLKSSSAKGVLNEMAKTAEYYHISTSAKKLLVQLLNREQTLSTAIGSGVAIPHPRNPSDELFNKPGIIFARSIKGIHFNSPDKNPTHLFFLCCATDVVIHLKLLSKIASLMSNKNVFNDFMKAKSQHEILRVFLQFERKKI